MLGKFLHWLTDKHVWEEYEDESDIKWRRCVLCPAKEMWIEGDESYWVRGKDYDV